MPCSLITSSDVTDTPRLRCERLAHVPLLPGRKVKCSFNERFQCRWKRRSIFAAALSRSPWSVVTQVSAVAAPRHQISS